jgi:hypothetical protein
MVRVAICIPCGNKAMLEVEMFDHIEKVNHGEQFKKLGVKEYRNWFSENFKIEDWPMSPYDQPWLRSVKSFGIETRMRHE